jgi:hypothetical protein
MVKGIIMISPIGGKIRFGAYNWCVLENRDDRTLIITEKVVELRPYHHEVCGVTWETCDMRQYLNGEFYSSFSENDRQRIAEVSNPNPGNPISATSGGNPTNDRIFLLAYDEIIRYFGGGIDDQYNSSRSAKFDKTNVWVWLRSPGYYGDQAMYINARGRIMNGDRVSRSGGVRPALWLYD